VGRLLPRALRRRAHRPQGLAGRRDPHRRGVVDPTQEDVSALGTAARMQRFLAEAMPLGKEAVSGALADAGLDPTDVGLLTVVSCTGYVTPGLDILLARDLGMRTDVQRLHVGHMGCYAALPGLGATADFVTARQRPAVMLCLELTSLHVQPASETARSGRPTPEDLQQMVSHALFSDAAAPSCWSRPRRRDRGRTGRPRGRRRRRPHRRHDRGPHDLGRHRPRLQDGPVAGGAERARAARPPRGRGAARRARDRRRRRARLGRAPGGRRIVEVVGEVLGLSEAALAPSYDVLRDVGNCSSATVLLVLDRLLETVEVPPGGHVVAMAFGPGLTLYAVLLRRRG
jgi:predicted naringenin-chalcone synthase